MKQDIPVQDLVQQGEMTDQPWDLSPSAYSAWEIKRQDRMRQRLAEKGQPLVYYRNGRAVAEYPDGEIRVLS